MEVGRVCVIFLRNVNAEGIKYSLRIPIPVVIFMIFGASHGPLRGPIMQTLLGKAIPS